MLNFKLIYKILGQLLFLEALLMSLCLAMALFYREDDAMAFAISIEIQGSHGGKQYEPP